MSAKNLQPGDRVGEPIPYGRGLVRYNPGHVIKSNARGALVKFDHRDNRMWVPNKSIVRLDEENNPLPDRPLPKPEEPEVEKVEDPVTPTLKQKFPPIPQLTPAEPIPSPKPDTAKLLLELRARGADPWQMLFELQDALKTDLSNEIKAAELDVTEAESEVSAAENLLSESRRKQREAKEKLEEIKKRQESLVKRVV